jgi:phage FluMu protein Com
VTIAARCHFCGSEFGLMAAVGVRHCPHCKRDLNDFDPQRIIRGAECPGGCGTHLAITFEPLVGQRGTARCPACLASWPFRKHLERDGASFEPVVRVDLGD